MSCPQLSSISYGSSISNSRHTFTAALLMWLLLEQRWHNRRRGSQDPAAAASHQGPPMVTSSLPLPDLKSIWAPMNPSQIKATMSTQILDWIWASGSFCCLVLCGVFSVVFLLCTDFIFFLRKRKSLVFRFIDRRRVCASSQTSTQCHNTMPLNARRISSREQRS